MLFKIRGQNIIERLKKQVQTYIRQIKSTESAINNNVEKLFELGASIDKTISDMKEMEKSLQEYAETVNKLITRYHREI